MAGEGILFRHHNSGLSETDLNLYMPYYQNIITEYNS